VADACLEGAQLHEERVRSEVTEEAGRRAEETPGAATGRVVVEIKQPPRRGRGARRGGPPPSGPGGTRSAGGEPGAAGAESGESQSS